MTSGTYFPEQRHLLPLTLIRRERMLDEGVVGIVDVGKMQRVTIKEIVARGQGSAEYTLIDGARFFRLRDPALLESLMLIDLDDEVQQGQVIAQRRRRKRLAPISGRLVDVANGQIILQGHPQTIELEAGLNGTVVDIRPGRGVIIETAGGVLQGVWGNGRRAIGVLRIEPATGIESVRTDSLDMQYRGGIIITRKPLRTAALDVIETQGLTGVIAPSLEPDLLDRALGMSAAILLTEGFGSMRMSTSNFQFLDEYDGRQALLDAHTPSGTDMRRPEVIITVPMSGERPGPPLLSLSLQPGTQVRLTGGRQAGSLGQVVSLPKQPVVIDNGLRVPCAEVELAGGDRVMVPLANLEGLGR
jgi:hypothetical protein